ncbi:MAG: hypothetical protein OXF24_02940 [Hyphomicrobiales bacterium]|nr:hypothetical protein [Hyphomicrobiales bacterium]MCY4048524.1 hypothetical protein [Hyphomicrobiales bacterium]MCY4053533.1 hypothetical protein [Hyphomicrobiales bacterium]
MSETLHLPVCDRSGNVGAPVCVMKPASQAAARIPRLGGTGDHDGPAHIRPIEYFPEKAFDPAAGNDYAERR